MAKVVHGVARFSAPSRDVATSSKLIPLVDDLAHILAEADKNKLYQIQRE
jgi:hypothetical protein